MAAAACGDRAGQIAFEVSIDRARDMPFTIGGFAGLGSGEIEVAIDDAPIGIIEMLGQFAYRDQEGGGHGVLLQAAGRE